MNMKTVWCTLFVSLVARVAGLHAATLTENFETITGTGSYTGSEVTFASGKWQIYGYTSMTSGSDRYNGTRSIRLRANDSDSTNNGISGANMAQMNFDKSNGVGTVSFKYASYSSHSGGIVYIQYSTDGGLNWSEASTSFTASAWNATTGMLDASATLNIAGKVRIRVIKKKQSGTTNSVNIDDIALTDYIPVTPLLTASPQTLNLATTLVNVASASTNFILSGINLTADAITALPSSGFELSTNNLTFQSSSLTLYGNSGTLASTPIYVRLLSASAGTINGTVAISGGGTTNAIAVTLSGVVEANAAKLTLTPEAFAVFEATTNAASASQILTLAGERLTPDAQLTLAVTGGFEVSANGSYTTTLNLTVPASGFLTTNLQLRLASQPTLTNNVSGGLLCEGAGLTETTTRTLTGRITDGRVAESLAGWNFYGTNSPNAWAATTLHTNLDANTALLTRGAGASSSAGANSFRTTGFKNLGIDVNSTRYFETTLRATNGKKLSIRSIQAVLDGTATFAAAPGVTSQFAYSLDGVTFTVIDIPQTVIGNPQTVAISNLLYVAALQNIPSSTTLTLRYYASGQTTSGGWGFSSSSASVNGLEISGFSEVDLNQNQPPTLTVTQQPSTFVAGAPVSFRVETSDLENDAITLAFTGISGYTFTNNLLTWIPTTVGEQRVTIIASEPMHPQNVVTQQVAFTIGLSAPTAVETQATSSHALFFAWQPVIGASHYSIDLFTWTGSPITLLDETLSACLPLGAQSSTSNGVVAGASLIDLGSTLPGWSGAAVYGAMQTNVVNSVLVTNAVLVKLGTTSAAGWLQTPALDLSRNHGAYTVSFSAGAWYTPTESTNLLVIARDLATGAATTNLVAISKTELTPVVLNLTGGTAHTAIRVEGLQANYSRIFLDNIRIVGSEGKQYLAQDVQVSETTCLIQNQQIQSGTTYSIALSAVAGTTESDAYTFDAVAKIAPTLILLR